MFHFVYMWRTLSSFKGCSGNFIFLWEQLVYSVVEIIFYVAINAVNITFLSWWISFPKPQSAPLNT